MFLFSTPSKCEAQTFIAKLEYMTPLGGDPTSMIPVTDGSTLTVVVVNGWGQTKAQGFIRFASGDETRTSLLTVNQYNNTTLNATNGEYLPYAFESIIIWFEKKVMSICVANTSYTGTITSIIN